MTDIIFNKIADRLDPELVRRAAVFTTCVGALNRNKNHNGVVPYPIAVITDDTDVLKQRDPTVEIIANYEYKWAGMCYFGRVLHPEVMLFIGNIYDTGKPRYQRDLIETLVHELAHSRTRGGHGWTFRRMYALLAPHIFELFNRDYRGAQLYDLIARYQRDVLTERVTGPYSYALVDSYTRANEELAKHRAASKRMATRLARLGVTP